ncbi:Hypothetical protein MELLADRAFT_105031 [Melampsora larici-populina 98AG31]|uniref:Uncharacterized protein n=1 Tax=Melampsora larici-populina (strain 98AG31 / pathotype 3-4-7) TaxID=747676 RepID=F4RGQ4_MELLP|nr:Hypothetical protein MELLADRAFT_105031 [Melampsora larici-populina 98AG31]EGG08583.1 Hypothetical protein MELLADRAFT_105031 [Melampsora larici-populina 98AG31]
MATHTKHVLWTFTNHTFLSLRRCTVCDPDPICIDRYLDEASNIALRLHLLSYSPIRASPPSNPKWARAILITMLLAHIIMLLLASSVLLLRILSKKFTLASITRLAVTGLGMQLAIDYGISNPAAKVHIPGIKYVIVWIGVWCFCWSTACQYICARWDPPWQSNSMDRKLNIVPLPVVMMLNVMSVGLAIIGVALIMTVFSLANYQYIQLSDAVNYIEKSLADKSLGHDAQTYEVLSNFPNMPLKKLDHLIVYSPFIIFTYIQLKQYRKFAPKDWYESKKGPQKHQSKMTRGTRIDCRKEMRTLLVTAGTIYSVLIVEWPLLVWEYLHISAGHCQSGEGLVIREMGICKDLPLSRCLLLKWLTVKFEHIFPILCFIALARVIGATLAQTIRLIQPNPWSIRRSIQNRFSRQPPPQIIEPDNTQPPVRELTVSVLQVTESQASEQLDQPNFDILQTWAQRKAQSQLHVDKEDKAMEMDLLDTSGYQRHDLS